MVNIDLWSKGQCTLFPIPILSLLMKLQTKFGDASLSLSRDIMNYFKSIWMDGWMDGWMYGWMDEWMGRLMVGLRILIMLHCITKYTGVSKSDYVHI